MKRISLSTLAVSVLFLAQAHGSLPSGYRQVSISKSVQESLKKQVCGSVAEAYSRAYRQTIINSIECEQSAQVILGQAKGAKSHVLVLQAPSYYGRRVITFFLEGSFNSKAGTFQIEKMTSDLGSE